MAPLTEALLTEAWSMDMQFTEAALTEVPSMDGTVDRDAIDDGALDKGSIYGGPFDDGVVNGGAVDGDALAMVPFMELTSTDLQLEGILWFAMARLRPNIGVGTIDGCNVHDCAVDVSARGGGEKVGRAIYSWRGVELFGCGEGHLKEG
jgi:hypothetical protein